MIEKLIMEILEEGGFISPFVDFANRNQPAPIGQLFFFDENDSEAENKRIVCVRTESGGFGNKYVQNPMVGICVAGLQNKSDGAVVSSFAESIYSYFLDTRTKCGIIDIKPSIGVSPLALTEAGRPISMIKLNVKYDRGAI